MTRQEEEAREILRLEDEKDRRIKADGGADTSGYAVYCYQHTPDLARAYLDALKRIRELEAP